MKGEESKINIDYLKISILEHSRIIEHIATLSDFEQKCNYVVNNLLHKMISSIEDKQALLG